MKRFLAFDLGASSGRAMLGELDNGRITLHEIHRFDNGGIAINGGLFWNTLGLFNELKTGLRKTLAQVPSLDGIAIDTWGVDYALIDRNGFFAGMPRHYRDPRTDHVMPWLFERIPEQEVYAMTGIQFMSLNTLFQLAAAVRDHDSSLKIADKLLFTPNLLTYLLCGHISAEYSIATTSQLYNPTTRDWAWPLIDALGLKHTLFPPVTPSCQPAGTLTPALQQELKCGPIPILLTGSHDTASAVAAVPADPNTSWAYLSSGTWSLLGVERDTPLISEKARLANYTNEGGVGGKIRFLKNIMGLWLVQECRNEWKRRGVALSFDAMMEQAKAAQPFIARIDPNDPAFIAPGDMPARIADFCRNTGQQVPQEPGEIIRVTLESLAARYRQTLDELEDILGQRINLLHLVGGGGKDQLLNQFTANAIQRPVITGPVEATALGNILGQALATGSIASLAEGRQIVANSTSMTTFLPE